MLKANKTYELLCLAIGAYLLGGTGVIFAQAKPPIADQMVTMDTNKSSTSNPYELINVTESSIDSVVSVGGDDYVVGAYKNKQGKELKLYFAEKKEGYNFLVTADGNKFTTGDKSARAIGVLADTDICHGVLFNPKAKMLVTATGADAGANGKVNAEAYGVRLNGDVGMNHNAHIDEGCDLLFEVNATGGTGGEANALTYGIKGDSRADYIRFGHRNKILATAQGGNAFRDADNEDPKANNTYQANAAAYGVDTRFGDSMGKFTLTNNNEISATAMGGKGENQADALAVGVRVEGIKNIFPTSGLNFRSGNQITAKAYGGQVKADGANVHAQANGLVFDNIPDTEHDGIIWDDNTITAYAEAGKAQSGKASATAVGVFSNSDTELRFNERTNILAAASKGIFNGENINAYGVHTQQNGNINFNYGTVIDVTADGGNAYALLADGGYIGVNVQRKKDDPPYPPTQIKGAVVAKNRGIIDIKLDDPNSCLEGMVIQEGSGAVDLTITNSSSWKFADNGKDIKLAADGVVDLYSLTLGDNSVIDMTGDKKTRTDAWRTLKAAGGDFKITGGGNTIVINSDLANGQADKIVVDSTRGTNYIRVNYDKYFDGLTAIDGKKALVVDGVEGGGTLSGTFSGAATEYGLNKYTANIKKEGSDWYLTGFEKGGADGPHSGGNSTTADQINYLSDVTYSLRRVMDDSISKRFGELRNNPEAEGVWTRVYGGENKFGNGNEQKYTVYQGGFDKATKLKDAKVYRGVFIEYGKADNLYYAGTGESTAKSLGYYQNWLGNNGRYYDVVVKGSKVANDMNVMDLGNNIVTGEYEHWNYNVSAEYGYRKNLSSGFYYQPEIQLSATRIEDYHYMTNTLVKVNQDTAYSAIGRAGITIGKQLDKLSNIYLNTSILHEFMGDLTVDAIDVTGEKYNFDKDMGETWFRFAVGGNLAINDSSNLYFDVEKTLGGDFETKWKWNTGFRYVF